MWTRWNDIDRMFGAMNLLQSKMNRIFSDYDGSYGYGSAWNLADGLPKTNLYDSGDYLEILAEVPGLTKDDINIKIQGNYLEISGVKKQDTPQGYKAHRLERGTASFTRSFTLPTDVNSEKVEANLENGLLKLTLPKSEAAKPKLITIQ